MRKRIKQLAKGKFEYVEPNLSFSVDKIDLEVLEGKNQPGEFTVQSTNHVQARGVVYSTNPRMECLTPQFEGEEARIRFQFHSEGLIEGDIQTGDFCVICNQHEYSLSFCVSVSKLYADSSIGKIRTLYEFSTLAKENWQEAYKLFYSKNFINLIRPTEKTEQMIYRGAAQGVPCQQNLEEFLVSIGKKEKIQFGLSQHQGTFSEVTENRKETIALHKDHWGYIQIRVSAEGEFLHLSKPVIGTEDFIGSGYQYEYYLVPKFMHGGKNYGRLIFETPYQKEVVEITADSSVEVQEIMDTARKQIKEGRIRIMELYESYRLKRIVTGVWASESVQILDHLHALDPGEPMYLLMKAQALIINRQRQEAEWILTEFKREWIDHKSPIWGYYLYLMTLMEREPVYVDKMTREIQGIFHENPDSVLLFWVLSFLMEEFYRNSGRKLRSIEYWVLQDCASPYLYLEAYYLIWQDPYLLVKLDTFEIRVLRWAVAHQAITKDIAVQIFQITAREKEFRPVIYRLMEAAYQANPKPEYVGSICSYLIKGQQFDARYHSWFEKGIELELRITGLYEAFLLSLDEREIIAIPKIIQMYFQYDSVLPYQKMAVLYNNIIAAKDTEPEVYQKYRRTMGKFAMEQMELGHINDNLAVVYDDMLQLGLLNVDLARSLSGILFTNKLIVFNDKLIRAIVYQKQMKDPQVVAISQGEAYVQLFSQDYEILFEDVEGTRYGGSMTYQLQPLLDPGKYIDKCLNLAPDELPYIVYHFDNGSKNLVFQESDKKFFQRILYAKELSLEYKAKLVPEIIRYYQVHNYEGMIAEYLEKSDLEQLDAGARRYMLELLIENHMYERAYELLQIYGADQVGSAGKVALASYMIEQISYEDDDFLLQLSELAFAAGKYNDVMLIYLCKYYNGATAQMMRLWKVAMEFEIDTFDLEERTLVQMMYGENYLPEADQMFEKYYDRGGREMVVLAYLSARSHQYFVDNVKIASSIFQVIEARFVYHYELNDPCKLALLKNLSDREKLTDSKLRMEDELLSEYTSRNMYFGFYKKLDRNLIIKYHLYDKVFLEHRARPDCHVVLHYSRDEDGENFIHEDMSNVYDGIFVKQFVIFFGEMIQYYISEEGDNQIKMTESSRITSNDMYNEKDESRYNLLNQMLISNTLMDEEALFGYMKQYQGLDQVTGKVFRIL